MTSLSIYKNSRDTTGVLTTLNSVLSRIRSGAKGLDQKTIYCHATAVGDPKAYKAYKEKELPAVTFSGTFPKGKRNKDNLRQHSSLITLDIDGLPLDTIPDLLVELSHHPHVLLAFISPSGMGIKLVVRVSPTPTNDMEHKGAYAECLEVFDDLATEYEFTIDTSGKDCSRLCYLAHYPQVIHRTEAVPIEWDKDAWLTAEQKRQERFAEDAEREFTGEVDTTALDFIDPNDLDYSQWLSVITACKVAGMSWQQVDLWSRRGGVRYREGEVETRWAGLSLRVSWGAVVNLAKSYGYVPPRREYRRQVKLTPSPYQHVLDTLKVARDFLKKVFEGTSRFFAIRTDTGTGKTENAITYALSKEVVVATQSARLRDEVVDRADSKEIFSWGYRGIRDTDTSRDYLPCIQSERVETLRNRGYNPYKWICPECPVYLECKERGYLSQPDRAKRSQLTVIPFPLGFLDPRYREWAKNYKPTGKDAMILHDDLPIDSLFLECKLPKSRILQIEKEWADVEDARNLCSDFYSAIGNPDMLDKVPLWVSTYYHKQIASDVFTKCRHPLNRSVLTPDELLETGIAGYSNAEACEKLPFVERDGMDAFSLLLDFFQIYPRIEDAPIYYNSKTDELVWYLPPKPIKTRTLRIGFASATTSKKTMQRIFPDIAFFDANATQWHNNAGLFQLRENRNPRKTVLRDFGDRNQTCLSPTGDEYYGFVIDYIKAHPDKKHAVLSYQVVIDEKRDELEALGVKMAWYGNIVGLNEEFKDAECFHILFAPFVNLLGLDMLCRKVYGTDDEPLIRDEDGSLSRHEDGTYKDDRVQSIFQIMVLGEIIQAVGRARLNLYPNKVILWTSLEIDGISNRKETTLFGVADWKKAVNDLHRLTEVVKERDATEKETADAIESGEVQAVKETSGVTERDARRKTKGARDAKNAERDALIKQLHADGMTDRDIERQLKKLGFTGTRRTIKKVYQGGA